MTMNLRHPMLTLIIASTIGMCSVLLALIQYSEKIVQKTKAEREEAEAKKYRERFENATSQIISLQNENKELSQQLYKTVTGYESFPIIVVSAYKSSAFKEPSSEEIIEFRIVEFHVINSGSYPLSDLKIIFNDPYFYLIGQYVTVEKNSIAEMPNTKYDLTNPSREIEIGVLPKNGILNQVYVTTLPTNFRTSYGIRAIWNSGDIYYVIDVDEGDEKTAITYSQIHSSVINFDMGKIQKQIEENFGFNEFVFKDSHPNDK